MEIMGEGRKPSSFESRLRDALEKLDNASKTAAESVIEGAKKVQKRAKETSENFDSSEILEKAKAGISSANEKFSSAAEKVDLESKSGALRSLIYSIGTMIKNFIFWLVSFSPYLIPSAIILQTAIWVAYLSEGTASHDVVSGFSDGMNEYERLTWVITSILGAAVGFLIIANFDSTLGANDSLSISPVFDIVVILLLISSIMYLLKSSKSLYYLALAFFGSITVRLVETDFSNYHWMLIILCLLSLLGSFSAFSIPFVRKRFTSSNHPISGNVVITEQIEVSKILSHEFSEPSYLTHSFGDIDWNMDNAPIHPPKRPSRRSEYELYEWVGLLANIILWPTTLAISMMIGSGIEIDGTALSMEDNFIMLLGPAMMTTFFFLMQYRMDSSARDGSLYAAQKQAYLDEMEKYVEAKKAYLELVALQAEIKKRQLLGEESE